MSSRTFAASLLLFTACQAAADPDYLGEPLADLHGRIVNDAGIDIDDDADALALWIGTRVDDEAQCHDTAIYVERLPAEGDLSGNFELTFHEPPPAAVRGGWLASPFGLFAFADGLVGAVGITPALDADAWARLDRELADAAMGSLAVGIADDELPLLVEHAEELPAFGTVQGEINVLVLYLRAPLGADTLAARLAGGPLAAGYHFFHITEAGDEGDTAPYGECLAAAGEDADARLDCARTVFGEWFPRIDDGEEVELGYHAPAPDREPDDGGTDIPACG